MKKTILLLMMQCALSISNAQVTIEYIAHACFIIESPGGTRIAIDPYSSEHSMGYNFPSGLVADAVLITHPHYDHDADYYFGQQTPSFHRASNLKIGDVKIEGYESEHGWAQHFRAAGITPFNTIWTMEIAGLRIAHLGDNNLLADDIIDKLGSVDIVILQIFDGHSLYTEQEFVRLKSKLNPSWIIPMHYGIKKLSEPKSWAGEIEPWLERQQNVTRHESNKIVVSKNELIGNIVEIHQLQASEEVKPWTEGFKTAWKTLREVTRSLYSPKKDFNELLARSDSAINLAPSSIAFYNLKSSILDSLGRSSEVGPLLESGIGKSGLDDWSQLEIAHGRLAEYYLEVGKETLARAQFEWILSLKRSYNRDIRKKAESFLSVDRKD